MPYPTNQRDDLSGKYLATRQNSNLSHAERFKQRQNPQQPFTSSLKRMINVFPEMAGKVGKDVVKGAVEAPLQTVGGIFDAGKQAGLAMSELADLLNVPSVLRLTNKEGELDPGLMTSEDFLEEGGKYAADIVTPSKGTSVTGGLVRGIAQFLTGFIPSSRALSGVGGVSKIAQSAAAGAITDFAVFDPHEARLSDLIQKFPALQNPVNEFLQSDPNNPKTLERFKGAVEGLGIGVFADGFFTAVKALRAAKIAKRQHAKVMDEGSGIVDKITGDAAKGPQVAKKVEPEDFQKLLKPDEDKPLYGFDREYGMGDKKAGKERALNLNSDRMNTPDDIKQVIEGVAKSNPEKINEARREVVTNNRTIQLADDLGMTVEELLARRRGQAFNAEEALAARNLLIASSENIFNMAEKAKMGSDFDIVRFRRALSQHRAIQMQVSGMTAEAGRLLQSFNILSKSSKEQARMIQEAIEVGGGAGASKKLAAMIEVLGESPNPAKKLNKFIDKAEGATTFDMVYEAWINGLLSNPATHAVNILGNSISQVWAVADRKVASWVGAAIDEQSIPVGEASAQLFGMVKGAQKGIDLAWHVLKTGEPTDPLVKQEFSNYRSITAENLNLTGTLGRFADLVGEYVRIPGRMLMASDEMFKSIGYLSEVQAQAWRKASGEGLEGDAFSKRVMDIIANPDENIRFGAEDFARYATFTKPLGEAGKHFQTAIRLFPPGRVLVPFLRTPLNIMKWVGEHSVLAPMSSKIRAEIAEGGARRDLALAKIATGSMIMAVAADMAMSGQITGHGPANPTLRARKRETGWQPYSVKIGDKYHAYSRLDPIGATIGIAADLALILGQIDEHDALDVAGAAVISIAQNMVSKTYMRGIAEFATVINNIEPDPEEPFKRGKRYGIRMLQTLVPFSSGVAALERQIDPRLSSVDGLIESIRSRIPGLSASLPPRRNIFGEVIELEGGLGLDIVSPVYTSTDKKDPVADEIVRQKTMVRMPSRLVDGVRLNADEYDAYILLYSGKNNDYMNNRPLHTALKEVMRSGTYKEGTDGPQGTKSLMIKSVFESYRSSAKALLIDRMPKIRVKTETKKIEKAKQLGVMP